ncbi:hypothetical protein FDUTEX481_09768 [Tolypothrix sp. PCC 7601]|nr:hypothetical protein FDUTEX481_09768 [Tolypothrix sp. PCC 7601]
MQGRSPFLIIALLQIQVISDTKQNCHIFLMTQKTKLLEYKKGRSDRDYLIKKNVG